MASTEPQDARNAGAVLRAAGATGETLVELVDSLVSMLPPKRRSPRMLERTPLVRVGDLVPVAVDLSPLTDCDVVLESDGTGRG